MKEGRKERGEKEKEGRMEGRKERVWTEQRTGRKEW